ncbi:MAG: 16S rRNA (cytosine(967)-C(5))-methyltransferase RsmB, partial [Acidobacteriota bacterium]
MNDLSEGKQPRQRNVVAPARIAAFEILSRVEDGAYASVLLASQDETLDSRDRALCYELVMGVLRWQLWLDTLIEHFTSRSVAKLDSPVRIALRLGLYQLRFLNRIPGSAAVNESVNLIKMARLRSAEGLVNAVLRRATREPDFDPSATIQDPLERLAVATSHPPWLIGRWLEALGESETKAFASANNQPAPVAFRIVKQIAESEILERLQEAGATVSASDIAHGAWRVVGGADLLRALSQAGEIYIQDEASQLVGQVLAAQRGERVLDVCAAPGSKATQVARSSEGVKVVAGDLYEHRIHTVVQAARLQGGTQISCLVLDGQRPLPFIEAAFDRVLVDVPCSGTGTLRHNPEIRWRISAPDIHELGHRQLQILLNSARMVRSGGRLIYSTCSVEPEENENVVDAFLARSDEFERAPLRVSSSVLTALGTA